MSRVSIVFLTGVVGLLFLGPGAHAQDEIEDLGVAATGGEEAVEDLSGYESKVKTMIIPGVPQPVPGYYSESLGGAFVIRLFRLRGQVFPGARLLGNPDPNSPLRQLGLHSRDIITRLDGLKIRGYEELDRHFADTSVRYIKSGSGTVRQGMIYIDVDLINP